MTASKSVTVLWSKSAVAAAGAALPSLQSRLLDELMDFVAEAHDWFFHAVTAEDQTVFLANGQEDAENWTVYVQLSHYEPLDALPEDHPDPDSRGKVLKIPTADNDPDNDIFATFDDIVAT